MVDSQPDGRPLTEDEMSEAHSPYTQKDWHVMRGTILMQKAELDRLRAELEKAMRIVGTSLHSDVATERIKLENDRLRALTKCDSCGNQFDENGGCCEPCFSAAIVAHIKPIAAERDRLRAERDALKEHPAGNTRPERRE